MEPPPRDHRQPNPGAGAEYSLRRFIEDPLQISFLRNLATKLHPPEERAEYFETLSVYNNVDAEYGYNIGDAVPEGYSVASEVSTAKALLLPCHQPDPQRMDALFDPDNYFSRLLVLL